MQLVFDIETDGFLEDMTTCYVLVCQDAVTKRIYRYTDEPGGIAIKHHTSTTNDTVNAINKVFSNTVNETGGVGRVVPGINTTVDVGPNEIIKQAKKFGNDVNKDGFPKKLLRTKKK